MIRASSCFVCNRRPALYRDPATGETLCGYHKPRLRTVTETRPYQMLAANMASRYGHDVAAIKLAGGCPEYNADVEAWRRIGAPK